MEQSFITTIVAVIIGGFLTIAGNMIPAWYKNKQRLENKNEEIENTKKVLHTLLYTNFEKNILILQDLPDEQNPFTILDYDFFEKNKFKLAKYLPQETILYSNWLSNCRVSKYHIDQAVTINDANEIISMSLREAKKILSELKKNAYISL